MIAPRCIDSIQQLLPSIIEWASVVESCQAVLVYVAVVFFLQNLRSPYQGCSSRTCIQLCDLIFCVTSIGWLQRLGAVHANNCLRKVHYIETESVIWVLYYMLRPMYTPLFESSSRQFNWRHRLVRSGWYLFDWFILMYSPESAMILFFVICHLPVFMLQHVMRVCSACTRSGSLSWIDTFYHFTRSQSVVIFLVLYAQHTNLWVVASGMMMYVCSSIELFAQIIQPKKNYIHVQY